MIEDYFQSILALVAQMAVAQSSDLQLERRSLTIGFIRGEIYFADGTFLHVRELVDLERNPPLIKYVYHYQHSNGELVFRYDNAPHFPNLPTFPHHKHLESETNVIPADAPNLVSVLNEIEGLVQID